MGFGATGGFVGGTFTVGTCECGESVFDWCTYEDERRGFGGGGALVDDDGFAESPEALRSEAGFLGGGGADFVVELELVDGPHVLVVCVSVFTRRRVDTKSVSSVGETLRRSLVDCGGGGRGGVGCDLRGGSFGRVSG